MYGLVNRAIEQLVVSMKGDAGWRRVCARAEVDDDGFVAMCPYHDDVTYRLVGAASEELAMDPADVLEAFGEYWILFTAEEGYAELLDAAGDDLRTFLHNLNDMHGRVETLFRQMKLPHFEVEDQSPGEFLLHYRSERAGLAPMVKGLLRGLARRFGEPITLDTVSTDGGHSTFRVRTGAPAQAADAPADTATAEA